MKASNMIKSIAFSKVSSDDLMVITQFKNQDPSTFLADNLRGFGSIYRCSPELSELTILESQDYLVVANGQYLDSPDGQSVLVPDYVVEFTDGSVDVLLYKIN